MAIGEFSERSGLSAKRLRTYAAEGLLPPAAVDPNPGFRYYPPGQLADAQLIEVVRNAGVPLAEIRSFMRQPTPEHLDAWARPLQDEANRDNVSIVVAEVAARDIRIRVDQPGQGHPRSFWCDRPSRGLTTMIRLLSAARGGGKSDPHLLDE